MKISKEPKFFFVLCLLIAASSISAVPSQDSNVNTDKLYEEISGRYEFYVDGQITILDFHVKDGKLYGTSEGDGEEVEIEIVDLENLSFEATDSDGMYYDLTFLRNDDKKITKCVVLTEGMEITGEKIIG